VSQVEALVVSPFLLPDGPGDVCALGIDGQGDACKLDGSTDTLTEPGGSSLTLKTSGTTCFSFPFNLRDNGYQITGGTGRFAGATGAGNFVAAPNAAGTLYVVHIDGTILYGD